MEHTATLRYRLDGGRGELKLVQRAVRKDRQRLVSEMLLMMFRSAARERRITMDEYIKRETLINAIGNDCAPFTLSMVYRHIKNAPVADVTPVRHGRWEEVEDFDGDYHWRCSACGGEWYFEEGGPVENGSSYCPECGAKMDEEDLENL